MAQYYGEIKEAKKSIHRLGHKTTGLEVLAASWNGAIRVRLQWDDKTKSDMAIVEQVMWRGQGKNKIIYSGEVGK